MTDTLGGDALPASTTDARFCLRLDLTGRRAVVCGATTGHALSQIAALREAGAEVIVIAAEAGALVDDLDQRGEITWLRRTASEADLANAYLVVAATGDPAADGLIEKTSRHVGTWCDLAPATQSEVIRPGSGLGRVTLVGGGPGDPDLLTVAARRALAAADVVVTDRLAPVAALSDLSPAAEVLDVGKVPFGRATSQDEINRILVDRARRGQHVVRLKGGDGYLFGRGGEERLACEAAGLEVDVVPGITSALAVPGAAGIPVTHRGLTQGVTVVSGHVPPGHPDSTVDYGGLAASGTTLVLLMAVRTLPSIAAALMQHGMPPTTPAATIADGTLASQRVVRGTLSDIATVAADAGIGAPAVTVIGAVTELSAPT